MTREEEHLDLLSIFHYVLGGLAALFPCMFVIHIGAGIAMLAGAFGDGNDAPPRILGLVFVLIPLFFMILAWTMAGCIVAAGKKLKRRTSYTFCLVVAGVECLIMPMGTVLGVFTIVTLTKEPVKQLFGVLLPPRVGPQ